MYYSVNVNIIDSDGPLVLPPHDHAFVVTSILMQKLTAKCLFSGLPYEDTQAHISKLLSVCKSYVGMPDLDIDVMDYFCSLSH